MNRRFFQFLAWLSLLLLAGVIALWLRSYSVADSWACYDVSGRVATSIVRFHSVEISRGTLGFSRHVECSNAEPASDVIGTLGFEPNITREKSLPGDPHALVDQANRHGFFFEQRIGPMSPGGFSSMSPGTTGWTTTVCFPLSVPADLLLVIPLLYGLGMWRRRRAKRRGLCVSCGYDLRESRDQCPECGSRKSPRRPSPARRIAPPCAAIATLAIGVLAGDWGILQVQRRQTRAWIQGNSSRQLIAAIKAGDMNSFLAALDHGADPNTLDNWVPSTDMLGQTYFASNSHAALGVALEAHNRAMARELLRRGADPDARFYRAYYGPSPLLAAVSAGDVESVRLLLDAGATPNVCDAQCRTALYLGIVAPAHRDEITSLILSHHADPNPSPRIALHAAIRLGDAEIVRALLAAGADVNAVDGDARTSLYALAEAPDHRAEIFGLLLAHHPKFNFLDAAGYSPLHCAIRNRDVQLVELFVKAGADVTLKDSTGRVPLDMFDNETFPDLAALLQPKAVPATSQPSGPGAPRPIK